MDNLNKLEKYPHELNSLEMYIHIRQVLNSGEANEVFTEEQKQILIKQFMELMRNPEYIEAANEVIESQNK